MKKQKKTGVGCSDFKTLVGGNSYFVDKTMFIKEFMDNSSQVLLMTRPCGFGKTLNLSMIEHFFSVAEKESANLFSGFKIGKENDFCWQYLNQHPVINISLDSILAKGWGEFLSGIKNTISNLYLKHAYLLGSNKLKKHEKNMFGQTVSGNAPLDECKLSLKNLCRNLKTHHGKDAIILVDGYGAPLIRRNYPNYPNQINSFMQSFLGAALKDNPNLLKGLVTGDMCIGFPWANNIAVYTVDSPCFVDCFGFSQGETMEILNHFGLSGDFANLEKWRGSYNNGTTVNIYNPSSIVEYINRHGGAMG